LSNVLPDGPLALIGDVHGERVALEALLRRLHCHPEQGAPERSLVFLGDLVDRGPDSPGVVRLVSQLVAQGSAFCVLGNHEVNILRGHHKPGNQWFFGDQWRIGDTEIDTFSLHGQLHPFASNRLETDAERTEMLRFFEGLPLAMERADLRIVHACWHDGLGTDGTHWRTVGERAETQIAARLRQRGLLTREKTNRYDHLTGKPSREEATRLVEVELAFQNENPVKVAISGFEEAFDEPRWLGGKWRVLGREKWWESPSDDLRPVVVGHYWRTRAGGDTGPWGEVPPYQWAGGQRPVFCLDYSVGRRYRERGVNGSAPAQFEGALGALLWPEKTLVFDDGLEVATVPPVIGAAAPRGRGVVCGHRAESPAPWPPSGVP